ncbi:MAG: hypothetical protein OES32_03430 [Acidobacteriota bacterium]|nr:hypothetical protein [Acidobacteriota bacterium]MDH3522615.1 hypothetical protein [Acidobacteriota bacterium]
MIDDAVFPPGPGPAGVAVERHGVCYTAARWTPAGLAAVVNRLERDGGRALAELSLERRLAAWCDAIARFRDPGSAESEALRPALLRLCGLSAAGLDAALEAVLGGVDRPSAARLFDEAEGLQPSGAGRSGAGRPGSEGQASGRQGSEGQGPGRSETGRQEAGRPGAGPSGLVAVILAGNLPALAVQPLLPALALGRPVLLKSASAEPLFAPAFVRALVRAAPELASAVAAATWEGGAVELEAPILERAATVLVYGDQPAVDSVARRTRGTCVAHGPRASLAVVSAAADPALAAAGLARDVALFDQRGCLSVQAVYTDGDAAVLAGALARALAERAAAWPPGPLDPSVAAAVQQVRAEARLRGLEQPAMALAAGTVVVEPLPAFQPSPGLRTVRVHPLASLDAVVPALAAWRGRLSGAALAGAPAWALESALAELGVARCAPPGELQSPDALWHNGGLHPLAALGAPATGR